MKKQKFGKLISTALTLGLTLTALTGCGKAASTEAVDSVPESKEEAQIYRTLDEIKESGSVNIGVFSDKNPFGYVDENGDYQG